MLMPWCFDTTWMRTSARCKARTRDPNHVFAALGDELLSALQRFFRASDIDLFGARRSPPNKTRSGNTSAKPRITARSLFGRPRYGKVNSPMPSSVISGAWPGRNARYPSRRVTAPQYRLTEELTHRSDHYD